MLVLFCNKIWAKFPDLRRCLLGYFDSVAQQVWGFHHPLATSLRLVKIEDTLFDSAEQVLRLMLDVAKEASSANSEVCSLKDSLTSLLNWQGKFLSPVDVYQSMAADDIARKGHKHERVLLNMNRLGFLYLAQRSYDDAEKMSLEVLHSHYLVTAQDIPDLALYLRVSVQESFTM